MKNLILYTFLSLMSLLNYVEAAEALPLDIPSPKKLSFTSIDFEVRQTAARRFLVLFENPDGNPVYIKVYDMVGNLVAQEASNQKGRFSKEFDMSSNRSEVFIVEVGNARNNNTKRIFLQK
ncbi:MAG: hypothetical protein SFU27_06025 [Thermonemataceae bacterium]|nr:hypothetical protein [Thermonemataceae bacterium]